MNLLTDIFSLATGKKKKKKIKILNAKKKNVLIMCLM